MSFNAVGSWRFAPLRLDGRGGTVHFLHGTCYNTRYMYKCSRCKGFFKKDDVTTTGISKLRPENKYYNCRKCNTEKMRQYRSTNSGRLITNKTNKTSSSRNKSKVRARALLNRAVSSKRVVKPATCSYPSCPETKIDAHHPDYTKPLNVIWLCRSHHSQIHRTL